MCTKNNTLGEISLETIKTGMTVSYSQTVTDADIKVFAGTLGDKNPIYMDDEYAKKSTYKEHKRIYFSTKCKDKNKIVTDGEAAILFHHN